MKLTDKHLDTLRHMLGINQPDMAVPKPTRDYYCANPGDPHVAELERLGAVRLYRHSDTYDWYCCTDAGRAAAMASHKSIRLSKPKRVYRRWLDVRDALPDLTFRDFLVNPEFSETRRAA